MGSKRESPTTAMVLLEASGGLEVPLVAALAAHSVAGGRRQPPPSAGLRQLATGKLAKTDALDAAVLAHFAEAVRPPVRPLRDAETQALKSLAARTSGDDQAGPEKNR